MTSRRANNLIGKINQAKAIIREGLAEYPRIGVGCSFGKDSMVLTHLARSVSKKIKVFSVMTRYKPNVTYRYLVDMTRKYHWDTEVFFMGKKPPKILSQARLKIHLLDDSDFSAAAKKIKEQQHKNMYEVEPDACCRYLKVLPTQAAVKKLDAWLAGLRKDEGRTRIDYRYKEKKGNLVKINPILDWTEVDIWRYLAINEIPVNPMYRLGYRSLGCAPCTVLVNDTDPERAGRWKGTSKCGGECGIHTMKLK